VGNLSKNVRSDELKKEFEKYGPCTTTNKVS
jgi:RNA recognition motif-containing protein